MQARAWLRGLPVVRRVPRVPVPRADVEVDVDMESFGESGAYLWGALLRHPGGRRPGDEPAGYRAFATWQPLPTPDEARSFAEFWAWFSGVRARAAATGRTFAAYCYNAQAENRWLLASARAVRRPARGAGPLAEVEAFVADPAWVDLYAVVSEWFLCAHGKGLKRIAPVAGFAWRDPEASGENSMRWYRDAVGMDGGAAGPRPARPAAGVQRRRRRRHRRAAGLDDLGRRSRRSRWPPICDHGPPPGSRPIRRARGPTRSRRSGRRPRRGRPRPAPAAGTCRP